MEGHFKSEMRSSEESREVESGVQAKDFILIHNGSQGADA